jgi:multidrug transporter EmrE-like cation transporter
MIEKYFALILILLSALLDTYAAYVFKQMFKKDRSNENRLISGLLVFFVTTIRKPFFLSGVIAYALAPTTWFFALNSIELSVGYPLLVAFHLVFVFLFAIIFLQEELTQNRLIGCICIFLSVCFLFTN